MSIEQGVVLITGAERGLGRAFAIALAERGFTVALTARTEAEINATAEFGSIDLRINTAGVLTGGLVGTMTWV